MILGTLRLRLDHGVFARGIWQAHMELVTCSRRHRTSLVACGSIEYACKAPSTSDVMIATFAESDQDDYFINYFQLEIESMNENFAMN